MSGRRSLLGLVPAILAGLILRRNRVLPGLAAQAPDDPGRADGPGYETSDVHVGNAARVMAGLTLGVALAIGLMVWMMGSVAERQRRALPSLTRQQTTRIKPPGPNLQAHPDADIDAERAAQGRRLDGYAFLDSGSSRARIPIDRALKLTVGRPLDPAP